MELGEGLGKAALSDSLDDELGPVEVAAKDLDGRPHSRQSSSHCVLEVHHEEVATKVAFQASLGDLVLDHGENLVICYVMLCLLYHRAIIGS